MELIYVCITSSDTNGFVISCILELLHSCHETLRYSGNTDFMGTISMGIGRHFPQHTNSHAFLL